MSAERRGATRAVPAPRGNFERENTRLELLATSGPSWPATMAGCSGCLFQVVHVC